MADANDPEPEPDPGEVPAVNVGGKVGEAEKPAPPVKKTYDQLQKEFDELSEFASGIYSYARKNEEGELVFDAERIVDDLGYDAKSLKKKGETVAPTEPAPTPTPEPKTPVKDDAELVKEFAKDPKAFISSVAKQVADEVRSTITRETDDLRQDVKARKAKDIIAEAASFIETELQGDLYEPAVEAEVAKLIKRFPPKTSEDLVDLYHAAKGRIHKGSGAGLNGSNRGSSARGRGKQPAISPEEQVVQQIVGYDKGQKGTLDLTTLLGKRGLPPD